jgi:hypothetical protein
MTEAGIKQAAPELFALDSRVLAVFLLARETPCLMVCAP